MSTNCIICGKKDSRIHGALHCEECELRAKVERLTKWVRDLQSGMYVNCVYCGHQYGPQKDVPASMASVLKEHVKKCPEHPMSILYAACEKLAADTSLPYKWQLPIKKALEQVEAL